MIDLDDAILRFRANAAAVRALAEGVPEAQARWRPSPDAWSLLETVCHLADEERDDFRTRLNLTLYHPKQDWPPIDPFGWVTERRYNERDPQEALRDFLAERERSLEWLRGLQDPDWTRAHEHPRFDAIQAGTLLHSWLVHDQLHLRQLSGLHFAWTTERAAPYVTLYAGEW